MTLLRTFLQPPCFVHRVDAIVSDFREGTLAPSFLYNIVWQVLRVYCEFNCYFSIRLYPRIEANSKPTSSKSIWTAVLNSRFGLFCNCKMAKCIQRKKMCQPFKENIPLEKKFVNRRKRISVRFFKIRLTCSQSWAQSAAIRQIERYSSTDFVDNLWRRTSEVVLSVRRS